MDPVASAVAAAAPSAFDWLSGLTENIFDAATYEQQLALAEEETAQAQAAAAAAASQAAAAAAVAPKSWATIAQENPGTTAAIVLGLAGLGVVIARMRA